MIKIDTKGSKLLSFILGLVYGYRNADLELKVLPLDKFSLENHLQDKCYFINRFSSQVSENPKELECTHVCVISEDKNSKKVRIFIYKRVL